MRLDWVRYGRIPVILGLATRFVRLVAASVCSIDVPLIFRRFSTDFLHSTDCRLSDCCDGHALRRSRLALEQFGDGVAGCGAHHRSDAQQCGRDLWTAQFVADADQIGHAMVFEDTRSSLLE